MASRTYRAEAIVLKTIDFGETDRILTLLTRHFGKVSVVAKGIRKPTSRLAGHAEPLTHATYQLARGRNPVRSSKWRSNQRHTSAGA